MEYLPITNTGDTLDSASHTWITGLNPRDGRNYTLYTFNPFSLEHIEIMEMIDQDQGINRNLPKALKAPGTVASFYQDPESLYSSVTWLVYRPRSTDRGDPVCIGNCCLFGMQHFDGGITKIRRGIQILEPYRGMGIGAIIGGTLNRIATEIGVEIMATGCARGNTQSAGNIRKQLGPGLVTDHGMEWSVPLQGNSRVRLPRVYPIYEERNLPGIPAEV